MLGRPAYVFTVAWALPSSLYTICTSRNGFVAFELVVSELQLIVFAKVLIYSFDLALTTSRAPLGDARRSCSHLMQIRMLE